MSRIPLTLIGAGLGLAVSASVFTAATFTQRLIPLEWCLLLSGGAIGTGAVVGRISDRRSLPTSSGLLQSTTVLQPHSPESAENAALYTETCTTIAQHLCQVQTGTEEYQEALIAGAATTANLRSALVGDAPRSRWQNAVSRWQAASINGSDYAIDPISGAPTMFSNPSQEEPSHAANPTPPAPSDPGGSALPEPRRPSSTSWVPVPPQPTQRPRWTSRLRQALGQVMGHPVAMAAALILTMSGISQSLPSASANASTYTSTPTYSLVSPR